MNLPIPEQCEALGLPIPESEVRFHPTRLWRFDYGWRGLMIALEVEGGIWRKGGGAHSRPTKILRDIEKYNAATELGWRVYRATPQMVKDGTAIQLLKRALGASQCPT